MHWVTWVQTPTGFPTWVPCLWGRPLTNWAIPPPLMSHLIYIFLNSFNSLLWYTHCIPCLWGTWYNCPYYHLYIQCKECGDCFCITVMYMLYCLFQNRINLLYFAHFSKFVWQKTVFGWMVFIKIFTDMWWKPCILILKGFKCELLFILTVIIVSHDLLPCKVAKLKIIYTLLGITY